MEKREEAGQGQAPGLAPINELRAPYRPESLAATKGGCIQHFYFIYMCVRLCAYVPVCLVSAGA